MWPLFVTNAKFIEIVTFLVILTFQPELGESTASPAPADQKNAGASAALRHCGAQHYNLSRKSYRNQKAINKIVLG